MLFNSVDFLIFFPIVTLFYFVIPKKIRYIRLLAGWLVYCAKRVFGKKMAIAGCVMVNMAILFYFKYYNFFC